MGRNLVGSLPPALLMMMREFTVAVLRERPEDLNKFAMEFFNKRRDTSRRCVPMCCGPGKESMTVSKSVDERVSTGITRVNLSAGVESDVRQSRMRSSRPSKPDHASQGKENNGLSEAAVVVEMSEEERLKKIAMVQATIVLRSHDPVMQEEIAATMLKHTVTKGQCIIKQGDPGDNFYVIASGIYEVIVTRDGVSRQVFQYYDKGFFGELALLNNEPRSATINAMTDGLLYAIDAVSFRVIVLRGCFRKRAIYEDLLQQFGILRKLTEAASNAFTDALVTRRFSDGVCIIKEGDVTDGMYFIEDGSVRVTITRNEVEVQVAKLGKGQYFGEKALIENCRRTASVYAMTDVNLAFLDKRSFVLLEPLTAKLLEGMRSYKLSA